MNLLPVILFVFLVTLHVCHGPSVNFAEDYEEDQLAIEKRAPGAKKAKAPKAPNASAQASAPNGKKKSLKEQYEDYLKIPVINALRVRSEKGKSKTGRFVADPIFDMPRKRDLFFGLVNRILGKKSCALPDGKVVMMVDHKGLRQAAETGDDNVRALIKKSRDNVELELRNLELQLVGSMVYFENEVNKQGLELNALVIASQDKAIQEDAKLLNQKNAELRVQAQRVIAANKVTEQEIQKRQKSSERHVAVVGQRDREITDLKTEKSALAKNVEDLTKKSDKLAEDLQVTIAGKVEVEKFRDDLKLQRERLETQGTADKKEIERLIASEARLNEVERELQNERRNLQEQLKTQGDEIKRHLDKINELSTDKATEKTQKEKNQETINRLDRELQALKVWQASAEEQIKNLNQREKDLLAQMSAKDTQHEKEKGEQRAAHAKEKTDLEGQLKLSEQSNNTLTSRIAVLDNDAKHLTGQLSGLQADKVFLDSRIKELESDKSSLQANGAKKEAELKSELDAKKTELANIVKEKAVIEEQKAGHLKDIAQLRVDIEKAQGEYQAKINELKGDVKTAQGQTAAEIKAREILAQQIAEKENKLTALQAQVGNAESLNSTLSLEIGKLRERANNLTQELAVSNERHAGVEKALTKEVADLTTEKALLAEQLKSLEQSNEAVTARLTYAETREKELNNDVADSKAKNAGLTADVNNAKANNTKTEAELKIKNEENARFHEQLKTLQAENAAQTKAIADLNKELGNEKEKKGTAEGINTANKDRILDLMNTIEVLRSQQVKSLERIGELDRYINSLNIENGKLKNDVDNLIQKANKLEQGNQEMEDNFTQQAQEMMAKIASRDGTIDRLKEEYRKSLQQANDDTKQKLAEQLETLTNNQTKELVKLSAAEKEKLFNLKLEMQEEHGKKIKALQEAELKDWNDAYTAIKGAFSEKGNWCEKPLAKAWFTLFRAATPNPTEKIEPQEMADAVMGIMNNFINKKRVDLMTPAFRTIVLTITPQRCSG